MTTPFVRVVDLETTGSTPPAHGVCEIGWQDVEQAADGSWRLADRGGATLIDPRRRIPAVTQAVHHITDEDVAGAPLFEDVAPEVLRPEGCLALAAHRASFEKRFCTPRLSGGARWICTWKAALRIFPKSPSFSNQVLRYWRKPEGLDRDKGLPVHRAYPDAYVTAHHLRDMLQAESLDTLIAWESEPGLFPRVPHGPQKGTYWHELTDEALDRYARDRDADIRFSARTEQARRLNGDAAASGPVQKSLL